MKCQICGKEGPDSRTLRIAYLYQLDEISEKLFKESESPYPLYRLTTCKDCRGDFLDLLRRWINGTLKTTASTDRDHDIPVRLDGRTVMMSQSEYEALYPGRTPYRVTE